MTYVYKQQTLQLKPWRVIDHVGHRDTEPDVDGETDDSFVMDEHVIEYKEDDMKQHTIWDIRGLVCTDPKCFSHIFDSDFKQHEMM